MRPSRNASVLILLVVLTLFTSPATSQNARRAPASPLDAVTRAYLEGRYDEIDQLAEKLDPADPNVVALRAKGMIARGRYEQAEALLRPVAARAPASEAALELGLLMQMLGRPDADATLGRVAQGTVRVAQAADLARAGRALDALGQSQEANAAFRSAAAAAPADPAINTAWGELFLRKYNKPEALKSFRAALEADPRYTPAMLGAALALADDNPPEALELAKQALQVNPSYVDAHIFMAVAAGDQGEGHREEAKAALQKALAINPSSLDAHANLAAIAYVEDKESEFEAGVAKVLAIAPRYGEVYRVAAELAARNYRFDEAVTLTRRALALDPRNPRTLADLGTHLLRTGDEPGARVALDASFESDPYNVVTFNLLGLMDTLDKFTTVQDGDITIRLASAEAPVLQADAMALAHRALDTFAARYEFKARGPILIEIFPKHDDFAVRNVGLPGMIGALGACFGRVVTMDSPRASATGSFHWEATLWHELAHVITIQMSNQRVPRWLTEGISVYEEKRARAEWARQMDVEFAELLVHGETLKLRDLNAAFTDPRKISLAYYQASLLVEHLVDVFGEAGLRKLLRAYGQGLSTDAALNAGLDTDFDKLQVGFDQFIDRTFSGLRSVMAGPAEEQMASMPLATLRNYAIERPRSYPVQMALGEQLRDAGDLDGAVQAFERAAALVPVARGKNSPHGQMAEIALERKDRARAITELEALVAADFDNLDAARQLASLMREARIDDPARLRTVHERIAALDPFDADSHVVLGRLAMQRSEPEQAVREFTLVLALKPLDQASAETDLAESYLGAGKPVEAKRHTLAALEIAPTYARAQDLLLRLVEPRR